MKRDFKKYINPYFVETGSYTGTGIQAALDAGFDTIISIEMADKYHRYCKERFKDNKNVLLIWGDSVTWLPNILWKVRGKCTFWLDAHYSGGATARGKVPILRELEIITARKGDTILIDDMRLFRKGWDGITDKDIEEALHGYNISYEYGVAENDILVAR